MSASAATTPEQSRTQRPVSAPRSSDESTGVTLVVRVDNAQLENSLKGASSPESPSTSERDEVTPKDAETDADSKCAPAPRTAPVPNSLDTGVSKACSCEEDDGAVALRAELIGWSLYGGSAAPFYNLTHSFVPVLLRRLAAAAAAAGDGEFVRFGSIPLRPSAWATTTQTGISIIQLVLFFVVPPLADYGRNRRRLWMYCTFLGAAMGAAMICLTSPSLWLLGGLMYVFASVCWGMANVMYNAHLPLLTAAHPGVVSEPDPHLRKAKVAYAGTALSVHGSACGFGTTATLLLFALGILAMDTSDAAYRVITCFVSCWWLALSCVPFAVMHTRAGPPPPSAATYLASLARRAGRLSYLARRLPNFGVAIAVAFLANAGATSMTQITNLFADEVLGMSNVEIGVLALEFFVALLLGSMLVLLAIRTLHVTIKAAITFFLASFAAAAAYFAVGLAPALSWGVKSPSEMYGAVAAVGLAGGAVLAMARGVLASLLPRSLEAEFFGPPARPARPARAAAGYVGIMNNLGGLVLPGINTALINATNNIRLCFVGAAVAFALSALVMAFVDIDAGVQDAAEVAADVAECGSLEAAMARRRGGPPEPRPDGEEPPAAADAKPEGAGGPPPAPAWTGRAPLPVVVSVSPGLPPAPDGAPSPAAILEDLV